MSISINHINVSFHRQSKFSESLTTDGKLDLPSGQMSIIKSNKQCSRTITDPCYPVFRCDGLPVSRSLYEQYVSSHYDYELRDKDSGIRESGQLHDSCPPRSLLNNETTKAATDSNLMTKDTSREGRNYF